MIRAGRANRGAHSSTPVACPQQTSVAAGPVLDRKL
jgi:hypothetical protein